MGRFNRAVDSELQLVASTAYTATTTSTAVNIPGIGAGDEDLGLMLNITAAAGTHDASNYFSVQLEAGETSGGTYYVVDSLIVKSNEVGTGAIITAFNTRQISEAVGSSNAAYFRIVVTKVGSTATGLTTSAYIVKGV